MTRWRVGLALLALMLAGCASGDSGGGTRTRVPITELNSVVGRWDGLVSGLSSRPSVDQDLIDIAISADATYEAKAVRPVGVFQGRGTVELRDGTLIFRGAQGATAMGQLFAVGGSHVLEVDATTADGRRVSARLSPRR